MPSNNVSGNTNWIFGPIGEPTTSAGAGISYAPIVDIIMALEYIRPSGDISTTGWTTQIGGTTNLYSVLNESVANDSDYIVAVT